MVMEFYELDIHRKLMKQGIQVKLNQQFGLKIREKSLFEDQKKCGLEFGRKDENSDF